MEWRTIHGWSDYEISEIGHVRRVSEEGCALPAPVVVKPWRTNRYFSVPLVQDGRRIVEYIHRLVATTYLGDPPSPEHRYVCHRNDIPFCNYRGNLYWGTPKENSDDRARHGRLRMGEEHCAARFTEDQVRAIILSNDTIKALAKQFGCSTGAIASIKSGATWKHVPRPDTPADPTRNHRRGERCTYAKLTEADASEILASTLTGTTLAKRFGVSEATISRLRRGSRWKHLDRPKRAA